MRRTGGGADLSRKEFLRLGGAGLAGAAAYWPPLAEPWERFSSGSSADIPPGSCGSDPLPHAKALCGQKDAAGSPACAPGASQPKSAKSGISEDGFLG